MADKNILTILVPIKKWLESVGRNFKWSVCNGPVFTASRGETLRQSRAREGENAKTRRSKVTNFPSKNKPTHGTQHCITFTLHIYVPNECWGDKNNSPRYVTNKIVWPRQSSCVPLGKHIVGYFEPICWQWRMIITSYLSISPLSSEEGGAVKQLYFSARPESCKRERERSWYHVWERWVCSWERECSKTWLLTSDGN